MKMTMKAAAAAVMAVCAASAAHAAGFMLTEQSAGALGRAYAGVGVDGTDLSGVYYNPATMTLHDRKRSIQHAGHSSRLHFSSDQRQHVGWSRYDRSLRHGYGI